MHDISPKTQIACLRADIEEICRERDKAEAEAQALREEPDWSGSKTLCSEMWKSHMLSKQDRLLIADGAIDFRNRVIANLREQLEALRARVVVIPDFDSDVIIETFRRNGFLIELGASYSVKGQIAQLLNALEELARLNGKAVSEGLLRRVCAMSSVGEYIQPDRLSAMFELSELLGEGKEAGDAAGN